MNFAFAKSCLMFATVTALFVFLSPLATAQGETFELSEEELAEQPVSVTISQDDDRKMVATFTNHTDEVVRLIKPQDGSFYKWLMPFYDFTVTNEAGEKMQLCPRCGNYGAADLDTMKKKFMMTIEPGESAELDLLLPQVIPENGEYAVSLEYEFDLESPTDWRGKSSDIEYPKNMWVGVAKSTTINVTLKAR